MIYTVTLNPSLDYVVYMDDFSVGEINRARREMIYPGGKGINVALVLGHLQIPAAMLGFTAGFTGKEIQRLVEQHGGMAQFISLDEGYSRINLKISSQQETAVNGTGPHIPKEKLQMLMEQIQSISDTDILVLAGSIPADIPDTIYEDILKQMQGRPIKVVVDATGNLLKKVLKYRPFLIKPNQFELGELFSAELHTDEEITICAKRLQTMGARNVLVSRGKDGAILAGEDGRSMVAGFLAGYAASDGNLREALHMGICAGSASAFHEWLATKEEIMSLYQELSH